MSGDLQGNQMVNRRCCPLPGRGRGGGAVRARIRPGLRGWCDRVEGSSHPVDRGRPDLG